MIGDERQLNQAIEQLGRMHRALAALREEVLPHSQAQFVLMAEGPLDEIRRLECDIEEYSGAQVPEARNL
jgi:hypothetical protein